MGDCIPETDSPSAPFRLREQALNFMFAIFLDRQFCPLIEARLR
ncbi:MAG: hypothetical protein JWR69_3120 [Pedosphaera sp.]|nr:hypothetical protein [Pedosphaera sp.]